MDLNRSIGEIPDGSQDSELGRDSLRRPSEPDALDEPADEDAQVLQTATGIGILCRAHGDLRSRFRPEGSFGMEDRRLGRGLRSLLSGGEAEAGGANPTEADISAILPGKIQPRAPVSDDGVQALSDSIRKHGVLQPIVVRRAGGAFEIVAGERRWRAARLAGLKTIPVRVVEEADDGRALQLALVENVQREDLDPISRAKALRQLVERFGMTQEEAAAAVSLDRTTVANAIRLLELPEELQAHVSRGTLSAGHARALLSVEGPERQIVLGARAIRENLSVRQVEKAARDAQAESPGGRHRGGGSGRKPTWVPELEKRLRERLGCKAIVAQAGSGWRIAIDCAGEDEVQRVADRILGTASSRSR